ncbi:MAG: hypothetical protein EB137_04545 [Actinobacteria bacterium]|nr:hypothetical protein [Actinomycetota bacterium]
MLNHDHDDHDNYVDVELTGGLGNQLFQYSAGLFYAKRVGRKLRLDLSFVNSVFDENGNLIDTVSTTLKNNIINYLSEYRMINDFLEIYRVASRPQLLW